MGEYNVYQMLQVMSAKAYANWLDFYHLEPFGARPDELRIGALRAQLANKYLKKGSKPYGPSDFVVTTAPLKKVVEEQSAKDIFNLFKGYFSE